MSTLVDRFHRLTLSGEELEQLGRDAHAETVAKLWKSLTKEDHITILRHGTLQSKFRRGQSEKGDRFLLVDEDSLVEAEAKVVEDLSNIVQSQNPWGRVDANDSILANLINANKTDVALKLVTLFSATACTRPLVEKLFKPPLSGSNEGTKHHDHVTGSLLSLAARTGCLVVFKDYLSNDEVLHQKRGKSEDTLLHIAAEHGHANDVSELVRAGARCELNGNSWTPLHSAAAAKKPNATIAAQLVQHICQVHGASYINHRSNRGNTALHIAAYNVNTTVEFLHQLRDADPFSVNDEGLTALDVAAAASESPGIIIAMLGVFLPVMSRVELEDKVTFCRTLPRNEQGFEAVANAVVLPLVAKEAGPIRAVRFKLQLRKSLLETCVRNCLIDAVVYLIEHDTDKTDILHVIVTESVAHPEKIDKLKVIYRLIVDHVMRPTHWWLKTGGVGFFEEDFPKEKQINEIIELIEKPSPLFRGMSAIELAIHTGAREMLEEIVNTLNVYRFENYTRTTLSGAKIRSQRIKFDVTNMINETYAGAETASPKTCYLEAIVNHEEVWRESDIFDTEPFKKLTLPHVVFVQRIYLVMGIIQMIFMVILSVYHIPTTCSLSEQFGLNISWCVTQDYGSCSQQDDFLLQNSLVNCIVAISPASVSRTYPNGAWLLWPSVLCLFVVCSAANDLISWLLSKRKSKRCDHKKWCLCCCCFSKMSRKQHQPDESDKLLSKTAARPEPGYIKLLSIVLKHVPHLAFSVSVFVWFYYYKNVAQFPLFLEALSVVFLFGWMLTFFHLSGVHKYTYMFSLILKEIIIKDIFSNFMPIFVFTVVGFGFAMHVLIQTTLPADTAMSLNVTIYNTFLATVNLGNLAQATFDPNYYVVNGRLGFFRVMFAIYVSFAAIVLLQVLVSMFTNRYQTATSKAAYMWRFDCVSVVITLQKLHGGLRRLTRKSDLGEGLVRFIDAIPYFLYKCKFRPSAESNRHFIFVKSRHARSMT